MSEYDSGVMPPERDAARTANELRLVIGRLVRRLRAEHTLSISHAAVLGRLERDGAQTASELALAERVRPQSMAQTISDLAGEGFVTRTPDPGDRRQTLIELTEVGREILERERSRRDGFLAVAIATGLTPSEQEALARAVPLLGRLADM
jgi:DNA-binding MarR family transcriptional regulator